MRNEQCDNFREIDIKSIFLAVATSRRNTVPASGISD
jgi:hypothetical protein